MKKSPILIALFLLSGASASFAESPGVKPLSKVVTWPGPGPEPLVTVGGGDSPTPTTTCSTQLCDPTIFCFGGNAVCVLQTFQNTQWRICLNATQFGSSTAQASKGYAIGPVDVRLLPSGPFRRVVYEAGLAELFTPYHDGDENRRYYDTRFADWSNWRRPVTQADAGQKGTLLTLSQDALPHIVAECRDRGVAWLCKQDTTSVRRGQELVLWGIYDAGNYDFLQEFRFQDDGTIGFRIGATGYNHPQVPDLAHMHDALWRLDLDLDGAPDDTARLFRHLEPAPSDPTGRQALDQEPAFNNGLEGRASWSAVRFNSLLVEDSATNALGHERGFELHPLRTGASRHFGTLSGLEERWTQSDFWVTVLNGADPGWADPIWRNPDTYLLPSIANTESILKNDLVLWYFASAHHDPIDEDRDSALQWGITLTHWFGFTIEPHDFFDSNPLGGPVRCGS